MRKLLAIAAASLLLPAAAEAQMSLGVKAGLAFPYGEMTNGNDQSNAVKLDIPLEVNGLLWVGPNLGLGAYAGYGIASPGSGANSFGDYCDASNLDCSAHQWRLGVKGEFRLGQGPGFAPYVGANFGMEWLVLKESGYDALFGNYDMKDSLRGWELGLEAGGDLPLSSGMSFGIFANLSFGEYNHQRLELTSDAGNSDQSQSISNTAMHGFFTIGVRGTFGGGGGGAPQY